MARRDPVDADRYNHFICPNCGGEVRVGAICCPHCTPKEAHDWETTGTDEGALSLPGGYGGDEDFDYDRFIREEFGEKSRDHARLRQGLREMLIGLAATLIGIALLYSLLTV